MLAVDANGLELAKVYDLRNSVPPPFTHLYVDSAADLDGWLRLLAYRLPQASMLPGESQEITLYFKAAAALEQDVQIDLTLVDPVGNVVWHEVRHPAGVHTRDWTPDTVYADPYRVTLPPDTTPGDYRLELQLLADDGATPWPGTPHQVATLAVQLPAAQVLNVTWPDLALSRIRHAPQVAPGQTLIVDLTATGRVGDAIKFSLRLVDPAGKTWAQQDKVSASALRFDSPSPDAPPGDYTIQVVAYDGITGTTYGDSAGQSPTVVGMVAVMQ